ncbi:TPA: DUF551 domain-containing protein [Klebsiella pneumoniae]|nr:DUF551 domain-containing protein [Klebsiella pneumoniae]HCD7117482.1 DUF551 domain-containing protein [Klebsiella pneumoniae]
MTKSTITRERLEWLSQISCRDDIEDIGGDEIRELASMALAAMDSDPVAWRRFQETPTDGGYWILYDYKPNCSEVEPLYRHAQPALEYPEVLPCPVLLEPGMRFGKGVKIRLVLEAIQRRAEHCAELEAMTPDERAEYDANIEAFKAMLPQPAPLVPDKMTAIVKDEAEYVEGWNACRAAMLQELKKSAGTEAICRSDENVQVLHTKSPAQSDCCPAQNHVSPEQNGDTPAQSQGWIPVSEQMPEVGDIVLTAMGGAVNVGEMECSAANCRFFTSVISGRELPATHWMPLPAGPKEDIKALIPLVSRNEQEGK